MEHYSGKIRSMVRDGEMISITISVEKKAGNLIRDQDVRILDVGVDDGRTITRDQQKKIYATLRDIADYTGYAVDDAKQLMKVEHLLRMEKPDWFSLGDCSVTTAREFINTLMEYALHDGIPLSDYGIDRTDDSYRYLIQCIRYRRCCICGRDAEIHHVDAIGMGNDRRTTDDSHKRIVALCRLHHTIAHSKGWKDFSELHRIYGIEKYRTEGR